MKKIVSLMLVLMLIFTLVGCNQNEQMDEMAQKIAQLEQALQNQADVNNEVSAELEQQKAANDWLGQLILTQQGLIVKQKQAIDSQQGLIDGQKEVVDSQQKQIDLAQKAIDNLLGKPIEFTAEAPVYGLREESVLLFMTDSPGNTDDVLPSFMNYYNTEFKDAFDERFLLLDADDNEIGGCCTGFQIRVCAESVDGEYVNPMIIDYRDVFDESIKYYNYYKELNSIGGAFCTVDLSTYLVPLPNDFNKELLREGGYLNLVFGQERDTEYPRTYCNIYVGRTCIGTCYYSVNATLTYRWFERYFEENLFLGE
ncbi:MAG: hypothetical protein E7350_01005 [Clostridiales bacterium]|nr:hypothetical protein [Clostridiales bacterium]